MDQLLKLEKQLSPLPESQRQSPLSAPLDDLNSDQLEEYLSILNNPDFMEAIQQEAHGRAMHMLEGLSEYQDAEIEIDETPFDVLWEKGNARLLDYSGDESLPAVLCIPSLINKYYILDLYPERSLIAYLLDEGFRPLVLDWGEPATREKSYDCADYVYYVALEALRYLHKHHDAPIHLLGYCMGGIFAAAMAQLKPDLVDSLTLLATPWDYQAEGCPQMALDEAGVKAYAEQILAQDTVAPVWTQSLFHMLNPWHFQEKFQRYPDMKPKEQFHFVAVESWVNDGVALARKAAKNCFVDWPCHNELHQKQWRVHGEVIDPTKTTCPVFLAAPTKDRIVPLQSALALAQALPDAHVIQPESGHVSMVVGSKAKQSLWKPLTKWLHRHS